MEIVTKAKKSCTAFEKPGPRRPGRGRPSKKGAVVHLKELFISHKEQFQEAEMELYGKRESIRYYCTNLLWGQKLYQELWFVLVEMNGIQSILASTSLALDPQSIIRRYRFRIKCTFRELKQQFGAFCYHFWSKYMPKLSYYQKKGDSTPMERVEDETFRKKILETVCATEMHMALSCIAMGCCRAVPFIILERSVLIRSVTRGHLPKGRVLEATLMHYFRKHFFRLLAQKPELCITRIIQGL